MFSVSSLGADINETLIMMGVAELVACLMVGNYNDKINILIFRSNKIKGKENKIFIIFCFYNKYIMLAYDFNGCSRRLFSLRKRVFLEKFPSVPINGKNKFKNILIYKIFNSLFCGNSFNIYE